MSAKYTIVQVVSTTHGNITFIRRPHSVLVKARKALGTNIVIRPTAFGYEAEWKREFDVVSSLLRGKTEKRVYERAVRSLMRLNA